MRGLTRWPGYAALNRPLTVLGVERRLFLLGATLAVAVWNATASLVAGGLVFAGCYGAGWLAGRRRWRPQSWPKRWRRRAMRVRLARRSSRCTA